MRTLRSSALVLFSAALCHAGEVSRTFHPLRVLAGLSKDEWAAVDRGEVVSKVLDTHEKREVAVVGAAWVRAPKECFVEKFRDIEKFKRNSAVLQIAKFNWPIGRQDIASLTLEPGDVESLRTCRLGSCDVKLPAHTIRRLQREVDWSAPDYRARVEQVFREDLLNYIGLYLRYGNSALMEYRDKAKPVSLVQQFRPLLDALPRLDESGQKFYDFLAEYPNMPMYDVEEFLYWSKERFGLKPVISVTHVAIYRQPGEVLIASKQIYASHYFDASLGLTAALDHPTDPSRQGMYLVYLNRSRVDALGGLFSGLRRAILRKRLRDGVKKTLGRTVQHIESSCNGYIRAAPAREAGGSGCPPDGAPALPGSRKPRVP